MRADNRHRSDAIRSGGILGYDERGHLVDGEQLLRGDRAKLKEDCRLASRASSRHGIQLRGLERF